jgi:hypothetical protein
VAAAEAGKRRIQDTGFRIQEVDKERMKPYYLLNPVSCILKMRSRIRCKLR